MIDKLRRRNVRTSDTQRHELTGEQTEDKPLRPDTDESSPKGLEKNRRRIEPDLRSRNLLVQGEGGGIGLFIELGRDWGSGLLPGRRIV